MRNELAGSTLIALLLLGGCSPGPEAANNSQSAATIGNSAAGDGAVPSKGDNSTEPAPLPTAGSAEPATDPKLPPVEPPAPGTPGGLPDDRTPLSEAPFAATSAQGAATVVQTYFALIESGKRGEAWQLWSDGGKASGMSREAFAASFAKYAEYHAQIGAPGAIEGAAGSLYVEVPVVIYGRLKTGQEVHMKGPLTLRRVNDVPGSTAQQRQWHIQSSGLKPSPG